MFHSPFLSNLSIFLQYSTQIDRKGDFCVNLWQFYQRPNFLHKRCLWQIPRLSLARQVLRLTQKMGEGNWLAHLIVSSFPLSLDADDDVGDDFVFGPLDPRLIIIWSSLRVTLIFILTPGTTSWHLSYRSWSNIFCLDDHSPSFEMEAQYV